MRTLKKTLCLVLAVVLVLGTVVISANAFSDDEAITYKEAVAVLTGIGVIKGMDDGSFSPDGQLTRAQAATIIARLAGADDIKAKSNFEDTQGHWAENAIAYCAAEGIVNGVGDNKFDPEGVLTGSAWAKMLLVAAGFDADENGMTGEGWEVAVAKLVKSTKIAADVKGFDATAAINREKACALAYRALDVSVSGESVYVVDGLDLTFDNFTEAFLAAGSDATKVHKTSAADSLASTNFPTLAEAGTPDAFGRPARQVVFGTPAKVLYNEPATAAYKFTVAADGTADVATLNAALKLTGAAALTAVNDVLVNGVAGTALKAGDEVEVYTDKTVAKTVVVTHYTFAKVVEVKDLTKSELVEGDPSTKKITLSTGEVIRDGAFAGFAYEEGDYILAAINGTKVLASKAAETVTGKVDATKGAQVRISGKYYSVNGIPAPGIGTEATWALDATGALAAVVEAKTVVTKSTDYALIYNFVKTTTTGAPTIDEDGHEIPGATTTTYTVYYATTDGAKHSAQAYTDKDGKLVGLKTLAFGEQATVVAFEMKGEKFESVEGAYTVGSATGVTLNKTATVAAGLYANGSTVYLKVAKNAKNIYEVSTVIGYKNATITAADISYVYNADTKTVLYVFTAKDITVTPPPVVVKKVAVMADASAVITKDEEGHDVYTYAVIIDGAEATVQANAALTITKGQVFEYEETNGFVTSATALTTLYTVDFVDGAQVMIGTDEYDQTGAKVYAFDKDGNLSEGTLKAAQKIILVKGAKNSAGIDTIAYAFIPFA